jgi:hypothetical protein
VAWNAAAVRRGPLVVRRNALKLGQILAGDSAVEDQHEIDAMLVADTLGSAWRLEGWALAGAADAVDQSTAGPTDVEEVIAELRVVAELSARAADRLATYQDAALNAGGDPNGSNDVGTSRGD